MTTTGKRITPRERHVAAMSAGERLRETMAPARERRDETLGRARDLETVQSSVPPMSYDVIRAQVTRELGAPPEEMFERFEPEAFAAASLGQVHRAVLPAGDEVVVKIQYPGVEATVVQDLRNVRALL